MDDLPQPLTYEETPVIETPGTSDKGQATIREDSGQAGEEAQAQEPQVSPPPETPPPAPPAGGPAPVRKRPSVFGFIGNLLLFVMLFGVGMWLSTVIRPYLPGAPMPTSVPTAAPTGPRGSPGPTVPADPYALWQTYQVISGVSRQPVAGVSFKLPPDVLSPICDGTACASQGTYLPGGTRFTVASRGAGQALRDYRGAIVSDLLGQPFTTKNTLVSGRQTVAFTGTFTGTTIGGYAFSRMAGVMVPVTDTLSVEINHFTPSGVTADFESDASLFDKILASVTVTGALGGGEKGAVIPVISPTLAPLR